MNLGLNDTRAIESTKMSSQAAPQMPSHGPFPPTAAGLGGTPTTTLDVPITAVFIAIFICLAATHMTILQVNRKRGHKFILSGLLFGFCMTRIVASTMRIVWSTRPKNIRIAIAAQVFVAAGVLLLFIVNLIFAQRIVRASHPQWAWAKWFSVGFKVYYVSIVLMLVALITCTVQGFYTLSTNTKRIDRDVQLVGMTYFATAAFLPIPLVLLRLLLPRKVEHVDKFGQGRFRTKIRVVVLASLLLTLGATFRAAVAYCPRPRDHPAWYHSKPCFYLFNFTIEVTVVTLFAAIRVDRRFHIPNGAHGAGAYSAGQVSHSNNTTTTIRISSEEEYFDMKTDEKFLDPEAAQRRDVEKGKDLEAGIVPATSSELTEGSNAREIKDASDKEPEVKTISETDSQLTEGNNVRDSRHIQ